jgi:hypothetical protein
MGKVQGNKDVGRAFSMPKGVTITFRTSSLTNAFAAAMLPNIEPETNEVAQVLDILEIDPDNLTCAYCGDKATEWEHLHPIVKERFPTGYPSSIKNLVPSCGKCNQSKGGKEWRHWIVSDAPLSPKSRGIKDLDKRIIRIEAHEKWASCCPIPVREIIGESAYSEYFGRLEHIVNEMKQAQRAASVLKAKISEALKLNQ